MTVSNSTTQRVCLSLLFILLPLFAHAHMRLRCPLPRDWNDASGVHIAFENTGNKDGPCGPFSNNYGMGGIIALTPNTWQTISVQESISHIGSPFRLSLLDEAGNTKIVLLDHVPHNDKSIASPASEADYQPYNISVFIPDVLCERCSLQLVAIMTDKTTRCGIPQCTYYADDSACSGHTDNSPKCGGAPNSNPCKRPNTCFSNYHSCSDVTIKGTIPIDSGSPTFAQPSSWPFANLTSYGGAESAAWSNAWLPSSVPAQFTTPAGIDLCAAVPMPHTPQAPTSGLGPGAVLGIVIASVALLLGAAGLVVWQRTKQAANADADGSDKVALRNADGEADRSYPARSAHGAV